MFNILIHLLGDSNSSLFWGILAGGGLTALLFILARGWRRDASFTPLSYAVGAVTGILLIIQCTLISGSLALMTQVDTVHDIVVTTVNTMVETGQAVINEVADKEEARQVADSVMKQYPIIGYFVDETELTEITGRNLSEIPDAVADILKGHLRGYIFRRLIWMLAFMALGTFLLIRTLAGASPSRRVRPSDRTGARATSGRPHRPDVRRSRYRR